MKKKKKMRIFPVIVCFIFFGISMFLAFDLLKKMPQNREKYFTEYNQTITNNLNKVLAQQKVLDEEYQQVANSQEYTLSNPYVKVNPYEISPLTALIIFETASKVTVDVKINDLAVTTMEAGTTHIIPIIGLYANATNIIELTTSQNESHTLEIKTGVYNDTLTEFDFAKKINNYSHLFVVGDKNANTSYIRGFDHNKNLMYYLELDYLSSISFRENNRFHVSYNSKKGIENDVMLEMDYLGKIYNVTNDTNSLNKDSDIIYNNEEYQCIAHNIYNEKTDNYKLNNKIPSNQYLTPSTYKLATISNLLDEAKIYDHNYTILLNGENITFKTEEDVDNISLLLIDKSGKVYEFVLKSLDSELITSFNTSLTGDYVLYLKLDENYYNLLTTIKN